MRFTGRRFSRPYQWSIHFTRSSNVDGQEACIAPLLQQSQYRSGKFTCHGVFRDLKRGKIDQRAELFDYCTTWGCGTAFKSAEELLKHWQDHREDCLSLILEREPDGPDVEAYALHAEPSTQQNLLEDSVPWEDSHVSSTDVGLASLETDHGLWGDHGE